MRGKGRASWLWRKSCSSESEIPGSREEENVSADPKPRVTEGYQLEVPFSVDKWWKDGGLGQVANSLGCCKLQGSPIHRDWNRSLGT